MKDRHNIAKIIVKRMKALKLLRYSWETATPKLEYSQMMEAEWIPEQIQATEMQAGAVSEALGWL